MRSSLKDFMSKSLLPTMGMLLALTSAAQADTVVQKLEDTGALALRTERGVLTIEPWQDGIIHVRFGTPGYRGNYNPAVIAHPGTVAFQVEETPDTYLLTTARLHVRVAKRTAAVTFLDAKDHVILEEGERDAGVGATQWFKTATPVYGLGQHQNGVLDYSGHTIHLQQANTDVGIPMLVSPTGFGLLWNNASVTDVDVATGTLPLGIRSEAGPGIDYHFILGPKLDEVIAGYRALTGDVPLMARWTWGMWQSKEHYSTQEELVAIPRRYRDMGVPIDAVVQDWQYWAGGQWGSHQFEASRYPDPKSMVGAIHDLHVHTIISVWPRFDLGTANLAELDQAGAAFPDAFNNVYPVGFGRWYDAWSPKGREIYWSQIMRNLGVLGFDGWWLDGDEAELGGKTGEMREQSTAAGPGIVVNNSFPLLHTSGVHDGMRRDQPDKRVFILSRSAYAGQQRNGVITWSGDTHASWETLAKQIPAALNFSLSGEPYWSADIGGFFSPDPAKDQSYAELFVRWHQFGVFNPMFRIHGAGQGKEIWNFDPAIQKILIDDVKLRYRLLPYIYSLSWDVLSHRGTMMRALAFDFPDDAAALRVTDQYMFGKAFLVSPVLQAGATTRSVYLPGDGPWFDFWTGAAQPGGRRVDAKADLATLPLFVRAGSIVPLGPVKAYADAPSDEPLELRVYPGRDAAYELYDDQGDGYGYQAGKRAIILLAWSDKQRRLTIQARDGAFAGMPATVRFRVVCGAAAGAGDEKTVVYTGAAVTVPLPRCR
ncbi:alpha-D-xyloside xylohydrolase [Nitrospirillum pindoramense]|uniref:Alpha-D-xyloside xylohydrolase n=2 Tax=Nitrospirillum amazonense TaxID=28077 RepID=A0A560H291_9PROT|nr:alpha-D-xyloside xylohydrolase [Nitrospirillum amazonense]